MKSGQLSGVFRQSDLKIYKDNFEKFCDITQSPKSQIMRAIDANNKKIFPWYKNTLEKKIKESTNQDFKTIVALYVKWIRPVGIHLDLIELPLNTKGINYKSFLIPMGVDGDADKCHMASTVVMKQGSNPNAIDDQNRLFRHVELEKLKHFTIADEYTWGVGDIIWWTSDQYHASSDFTQTNSNKEAFVIHTYV